VDVAVGKDGSYQSAGERPYTRAHMNFSASVLEPRFVHEPMDNKDPSPMVGADLVVKKGTRQNGGINALLLRP